MPPEYSEMLAAVAIGILSAIFISAFVVLVFICRRQRIYHKTGYLLDQPNEFSRPEVHLIESEKSEVELDEIQLNPSLERILADDQWVDDATGLIPHCLAILKTCRYLTEQLTAVAMGNTYTSGTGLTHIIENAKRISSRVDDMVRSMYPPLDPRLLEARAAALSLAVTQLALIAKYECGQSDKSTRWIDKPLAEMDRHMTVLRDAAVSQESISKVNNMMNNLSALSAC